MAPVRKLINALYALQCSIGDQTWTSGEPAAVEPAVIRLTRNCCGKGFWRCYPRFPQFHRTRNESVKAPDAQARELMDDASRPSFESAGSSRSSASVNEKFSTSCSKAE